MAKQTIETGASPNDRTGDPARTSFSKINANFDELYTTLGDGSALHSGSATLNVKDFGGWCQQSVLVRSLFLRASEVC